MGPPLLPVCCVCGLIRDELRPSPDCECWMTARTYRATYHVNLATYLYTHTYCPDCFAKARNAMKEYFRELQRGS